MWALGEDAGAAAATRTGAAVSVRTAA
jgi:hypothetical protein